MRAGLSRTWEWLTLPAPARRLRRADARGLPERDPCAEAAVNAMLAWLGRAQDRSASGEGGFAGHFDLIRGWSLSCPGSTGLAARAMLRADARWGDHSLRQRATWGLEWLCGAQHADGGFGEAGGAQSSPFATGQALLGLLAGHGVVKAAGDAAARAAGYLLAVQHGDGSWAAGRAQDTQIAWSLLEADQQVPHRGLADAAQANLRWALSQQRGNGWLANCCTDDATKPLTVTIGTAVRGFLEAYRIGHVLRHLDAAVMAGWALLAVQRRGDGSLPGRLTEKWEPAARWSGLSGDAQAAACWLLLFEATKDEAFLSAAKAANRFIRRTLPVTADADQAGGVRGSFPVDGGYGRFRYVTQAAVHAIDSNMMELALGDTA
ncbi:hypothetical protein [Emcibacter sp. SYSU 3D8]|uniref:hypothetical protein n=1 Tax=Emcibacter sp. SYSU 3D8 TaxID=3133969 RepID=UPI0031FEE046